MISAFGASNEVPTDESLGALFDRFLLRIRSDNLDAYHFNELLDLGVRHEVKKLKRQKATPLVSAADLHAMTDDLAKRLSFNEGVSLVLQGADFPDSR